MHYTYEYKLESVEKYRRGEWQQTPPGINKKNFRKQIRMWARKEEVLGPAALMHRERNGKWSPEERLELVNRVLSGESLKAVACSSDVNTSVLRKWVAKYKTMGYNGLVEIRTGRPRKETPMKRKSNTSPLSESEREELMQLRAEVEYLKTENEVIKKCIALRREREAAQLKAKKQQSSKSSEIKDIN